MTLQITLSFSVFCFAERLKKFNLKVYDPNKSLNHVLLDAVSYSLTPSFERDGIVGPKHITNSFLFNCYLYMKQMLANELLQMKCQAKI